MAALLVLAEIFVRMIDDEFIFPFCGKYGTKAPVHHLHCIIISRYRIYIGTTVLDMKFYQRGPEEGPPGGAKTRLEGRPVMTFPALGLLPEAKRLLETSCCGGC